MNTRKREITTFDGHSIEIVIHQSNTSRYSKNVAILTHGIFTDRDEKGRFIRLANKLNNSNIDVVRFNFRGHGNSPFHSSKYTITGALIDYLAVLNWSTQEGWDNFSIIGSSFGASIVMLEQNVNNQKSNISCFALLNPVVNYKLTFIDPLLDWPRTFLSNSIQYEILNNGSGEIQPGFFASSSFLLEMNVINPCEGIQNSQIDTIVFHGDRDNKVPVWLTEECFSKHRNCIVDVVKGAGHAFKEKHFENYVHNNLVDWMSKKLS